MVKSATRVIQILESVGSSKNGISHAELSAALNIPKGSLSLLLADLVAHDFLSLRKVVTLPTIRFNAETETRVRKALMGASEKLSRQLGFNPNTKSGKKKLS